MRRDDSASQLLFHGNPLPMWIAERESHRILDVNDAAVKAYGHSRDAFLAMGADRLLPEGESPCMICMPESPLPVRSGPWVHLRADGSTMEVEVTAQPLLYEGRSAVLATIHDLTDQHRIQNALEDSERLFHKLVEASPLGVYLVQGGRVVYANPAMQRFTGYGPEDLAAGLSLMALIAPEDRERVSEAYRRRLDGDDSLRRHEFKVLCKDGRRCPVEVHATLTRYKGRTTLLGMGFDLTERVTAQQALEVSEHRLRAVLDALPDGVAVHAGGRVLYANQAFGRIFGLAPAAAAGSEVLEVLAEPERRRFRAMGGWTTEGQVEVFGRRADGREFPVEVTTVAHDFQGRPARLSVFRDASERKVILDLLRDSESRYRSLFEHNLAGVFRTDLSGTFYDCNEACARILGFESRRDLMSRGAQDLYFDPAERERFVEDLRARGFLANHELCLRRKDGRAVWVLENVTLSQPSADLPAVIEGTLIDITERKLAERLEQEQAELLEMVAQSLPLESVLDHLARMVEHQLGGGPCLVMRRQGGRLRLAAAPGLPPTLLPRLDEAGLDALALGADPDPAGPGWASYRGMLEVHGLAVAAAAPIQSALGEPLGLVVLHRSGAGSSPGRHERDLLAAACRLGALAIEHAQLSERLVHQAQYDALTGLPNRLLFQDRLAQAMHAARRHGTRLAVMFIDLDGFKRVNDSLGHQAGDLLLTQVAARFRRVVRSSDTLARMGGDEFMVVLVNTRDTRASVRVAQKLLQSLREPFQVAGHELVVTASIGLSFYPEDGTHQDELQRHADAAMYKAKASGRNGFQCYTPELNAQITSRLEMEQQLRQALGRGELRLAYQPQHQADGRLVGFEALLRWTHPTWGSVPPQRFIPLAEECGLILPIGRWVLDEACRQCARWREEGHAGVRVAVNVSAIQFEQADWTRTVARSLDGARLPAAALELEITEGLVMRDAGEASQKLRTMREMGVSVAIDDFGTGYSSLAYLQRLPIDTLKIDQSFVRGIGAQGGQRDSTAIVETIVNLGRGLGLQVLAEGVETEGQADFLRRIGCDAMQGYYFGRPMDAAAAGAHLRGAAG